MTHGTAPPPPNLSFLSGFPKAATLLVARLGAREEQVIGYFCSFCRQLTTTQTLFSL